jgi:hypothetical protein
MKRAPIARKTSLRPSQSRMKSGHSTKKPTKSQSMRFDTIKHGPCMACQINAVRWWPRADGAGCDAHHLLSGGRRRGHDFTIALCPWHHRGIRPDDCRTDADALHRYGPSYALNKTIFHETYSGDDELLAMQNEMNKGMK